MYACVCMSGYVCVFLSLWYREVNSLIVLVTTPKYVNAAHDPVKCMDQLIYIANVSKYQKLLSWEPLFDLECINTDPIGQDQYTMTDTINVKLKFYFYGPKVC